MSVADFQRKLLSDPKARAAFAANPSAFLEQSGIKLPEGTKLPNSIPLDVLEAQIADVNEELAERGKDIADINATDTRAVSRFVEDAIAIKARDLASLKELHAGFVGSARNPGDVATVAVVGAVVAAVVAVPVAVVGKSGKEVLVREVNPAVVVRKGDALTLHGPEGVRVEGLNVEQAAQLMSKLRK